MCSSCCSRRRKCGKGALAILESGALDGGGGDFGGHVDRRFDVGQVVADDGPLAAAADTSRSSFLAWGRTRRVRMKRAILSLPPAAVVMALQTMWRGVESAKPGVVSIGMVQRGSHRT
jgi:hippurate hydrolase